GDLDRLGRGGLDLAGPRLGEEPPDPGKRSERPVDRDPSRGDPPVLAHAPAASDLHRHAAAAGVHPVPPAPEALPWKVHGGAGKTASADSGFLRPPPPPRRRTVP